MAKTSSKGLLNDRKGWDFLSNFKFCSFILVSKKFFQSRKRWRSELVLSCSSLPSVSFFAWCFALHQLLLTFCHTNQRILLAYLRLWKSIRNAELYWNFCIGARKSLKFAEIVLFSKLCHRHFLTKLKEKQVNIDGCVVLCTLYCIVLL